MHSSSAGRFFTGTSGLVLPVPNKKSYPAEFREQSRLTYYSSMLTSIEVNSSFYKLPQPRTVTSWADMVPEDFVFTFKLWKEISHSKNLAFKEADLHRFAEIIDSIGSRKGCILIQFPPSLTLDHFSRVEMLLSILADKMNAWRVAVEFRHPSWYVSETFELADEFSSTIVLHDIPKSRNETISKQASFVYLRFHGPSGDYRGGYSDHYIERISDKISGWLIERRDVFAYFNNTIGDAFANASKLKNIIAGNIS